jgi:tetratricopeptide (TPR) repeat protein/transcriptional regulator with XRE-family HTH domain
MLLRNERLRRGWTQQDLADAVGTTKLNVSRWERGNTHPGSYFRLQLCEVLGKTPAELGLVSEVSDQDLFLATGSLSARTAGGEIFDPAIPLPLPDEGLVGRDELLASLKERLIAAEAQVSCALVGLPGVGKTSLVIALVHDHEVRAAFPGGILWAGLGLHPNATAILAHWGALLGLSAEAVGQPADLKAWASAVQAATSTRHMLIVLDDVWRIEDALDLQVGSHTSSYLLTTRMPEIAVRFSGEEGTPVPELSEEAGEALLLRLVKGELHVADRPLLHSLAQAAGGLPLALVLMGNYLRVQVQTRQPRRVADALIGLQNAKERLALAQPQGVLSSHPSLPLGASLSLQAILAVSVQSLSPEEGVGLGKLAVFPPKPNTFSEEAARAVSGVDGQVLDRLYDVGLLESHDEERYALHQSIADYASLHLLPADEGAAAQRRLVAYCARYVEAHSRDYTALEQESATIFTALEAAFDRQMLEELIRLALAFFPFLDTRGLYELAREHLTRASDAARTLGDKVSQSRVLLHLGEIAQRQSAYTQAIARCEEGLAIARDLALFDLITSYLSILGWVISNQGEFELANTYLQEGLALARAHTLREQTCSLLMSLGQMEISQGDYDAAEAYFSEGMAIARAFSFPESLCVMLTGLGIVAEVRADFSRAEQLYLEGLILARRLGLRERIGVFLLNLGSLAYVMGDFAQGAVYNTEALDLARSMGHVELLTVLLMNQGELEIDRGSLALADASLQEGMALAEQVGFRERIGSLLLALGRLAIMKGDYDQAESYLQRGLTLARQLEKTETIGELLRESGVLAMERADFQQAQELLTQGLLLARQVGSPRGVGESLYRLAELSLLQRQLDPAEAYVREMLEAIPVGSKTLNAQSLFIKARVRAARGDYAEARQLGEAALLISDEMGYALSGEMRTFLDHLPPSAGADQGTGQA